MLYSASNPTQSNMTIYTTHNVRLAAVTLSIVLWFASLFLAAVPYKSAAHLASERRACHSGSLERPTEN